MNIYYIQYLTIVLICSIPILRKSDENCKLITGFFLVFLVSYFWATRELNVGSDTSAYYRIFESISPLTERYPSRDRLEIGYKYFISVFKIFSDSFFLFQFFTLSIIHVTIFIALRSITPLYFEVFSLVIVSKSFLTYVINVQRQGIAFALSMLSISFLINRQYFPFFIFSVCAGFFHASSIFFNLTAFIFFAFRRSNKITAFFILSCIAVMLSINSSYFLNFITGFSSDFYILHKITGYVENSKEPVVIGIGFTLSLAILVLTSILQFKFKLYLTERMNDLLRFSMVVCFFNLLGLYIMHDYGVISRIFSYITVLEFFCFTWCVSKFRNSNYIIIMTLLLSSIYGVYGNLHSKLLNNSIGWL